MIRVTTRGILWISFFLRVIIMSGQANFIEVSDNSSLYNTSNARGVALVDFNHDGYVDVFVAADPVRLMKNEGDLVFSDYTEESGLSGLSALSIILFDANNDGHLDLIASSYEHTKLFIGDEVGHFTFFNSLDAAKRQSINIGDLNRDQWPDIYSANFNQPNNTYINQGNGFFAHLGQDASTQSLDMGAVLLDIDTDGDLDVYLTYDGDQPNDLLINDGNANFSNESSIWNLDNRSNAMGVDFADFDLDGRNDLFIANLYANDLLRNNGDGTFSEIGDPSGVDDNGMAWGTVCFDYNNDGFKDIYFNNEFAFSSYPNQLLENQGDLTFQDVAIGTSLMNTRSGYGCAAGDLNNDGKQDLVLVNFNEEKSVRIFINQEDVGNWSQVSLVGQSVDKFGIGTRLSWYANEIEYKSEVTVGSGYRSQNSYRQHIGLGENVEIDSLVVMWMDGSKEKYENIVPNEHYLLVQGSGLSSFSSENFAAAITVSNTLPDPIQIHDASPDLSDSHSIARAWNEVLLSGIRGDFARPTVHARNLFHISLGMYDTWAITTGKSKPILIGNSMGGFVSDFSGFTNSEDTRAIAEEAISYATYRLIVHRFANSPSANETIGNAFQLMMTLGYDPDFVSSDYQTGDPAALGNFIASQIIDFGLQDGSNEEADYANQYYEPVNQPLKPELSGNPDMADPNRWQPLELVESIDQSGQTVANSPPFLSPEWGAVVPFALKESDLIIHQRDGHEFWVYHDPGPPPLLGEETDHYKWNFELVTLWSSHLDPSDQTLIDISPGALGNISEEEYPSTFDEYLTFYPTNGNDKGQGYTNNPVTNTPYEPQIVTRGDYTRVLAEFWADGPDSETPPGHWFSILNYVTDHPEFERKFMGTGVEMDLLEWDVKSYVTMGGAVHDAAISAWGIKGYYDYTRPISAIRYMADLGQSSDDELPNYHADGIRLMDGFIEMIGEGDPLIGESQENLNKIKLKAWKGPDYIEDPETDVAGVDWVLAENWWPYQRPSFVTPPFAGYISGHSTFSRAAAEVMTLLTGSEYFPGGMGEFSAKQNDFLVFEDGPSTDVVLQWAKYKDASDQCSLSRIWGGIHPPADDVPGRLIGRIIGQDAFDKAFQFFESNVTLSAAEFIKSSPVIFPNPQHSGSLFRIVGLDDEVVVNAWTTSGQLLFTKIQLEKDGTIPFKFSEPGIYILEIETEGRSFIRKVSVE